MQRARCHHAVCRPNVTTPGLSFLFFFAPARLMVGTVRLRNSNRLPRTAPTPPTGCWPSATRARRWARLGAATSRPSADTRRSRAAWSWSSTLPGSSAESIGRVARQAGADQSVAADIRPTGFRSGRCTTRWSRATRQRASRAATASCAGARRPRPRRRPPCSSLTRQRPSGRRCTRRWPKSPPRQRRTSH